MAHVLICVAALLTSMLTLFSGFGLGTLLMPFFAMLFPVEVAVALTAVVHFLNNLFKLALLGRHANGSVILRFGLPAIAASFLGALVLLRLAGMRPWAVYHLGTGEHKIMPVNVVIAALMVVFAVADLLPASSGRAFDRRYLPLGGLLSGFLGGISGHQGALRAAFLIRCSLSKEAYIATGVVIACLVDVTRISVYLPRFAPALMRDNLGLLAAATLSAFLGAFIGNRLVHHVTIRFVQRLVAVMLLAIALALAAGLI